MGAGISIADIHVARSGKPVLRGVSLAVKPGEITALVGRNGAGKSTLVLTIAGLLPVLSGDITLDDIPFRGHSPDRVRRLGISAVLEGHRILGGLTVLDNLRAAGTMHTRADATAEIERALALFPELGERPDLAGRFLSGGQKQMLAIAQALIARPKYLLVDELSFGLAPTVVKRLAAAIEAIAASGVGILLIEQFTTLALSLARDAHVLERGSIVFSGPARELTDRPEILHSAYLAARAARR